MDNPNWNEWNGTLAGYWWLLEKHRQERDAMSDPDDDESDSDLDSDIDRTPLEDKPGAATERIGTDAVRRAILDSFEAVE